jgi:hypothetical protein
MTGPSPFFFKLMGTVMDCDKMCGNMFEKGLSALKSVAESEPAREVA